MYMYMYITVQCSKEVNSSTCHNFVLCEIICFHAHMCEVTLIVESLLADTTHLPSGLNWMLLMTSE